jgi:hypothetical protein
LRGEQIVLYQQLFLDSGGEVSSKFGSGIDSELLAGFGIHDLLEQDATQRKAFFIALESSKKIYMFSTLYNR